MNDFKLDTTVIDQIEFFQKNLDNEIRFFSELEPIKVHELKLMLIQLINQDKELIEAMKYV